MKNTGGFHRQLDDTPTGHTTSPTKVVVAINFIITHPLSNAKKCTNHFKLNKVTTPRMKKVENENEDVNA